MLFRKKMPPACTYCKHGSKISGDRVTCRRHGVVRGDYHCFWFKYDPLKRVPARPVSLVMRGLADDDFKLD